MATTQAPGQAPGHPKTFVFVDEMRHSKRLKVMRACDGCRKRKIKCDGALQNGPWPCGACVRLKLKCVPPTLDSDDTDSNPDSITSQQSFSYQTSTFPSHPKQNGVTSHPQALQDWNARLTPTATLTPTSASAMTSDFDLGAYSHQARNQQLRPRLERAYSGDEYFPSAPGPAQFQQSHQVPSLFRTQTAASNSSSGDPQEIDATVRELSGQMGDLQIDITSEAPYISNHKRQADDAPAIELTDVVLPPCVYTDSTVRIPSEMMPSEERALDYFGYYFDHIHAYCPVLNRTVFFEQWRNARSSISPLLLEGIFACVARYLEEPVEARKWLALASRHEECFKDVPRLSTIQAMIILLKARESLPKRGYYYRSWMEVKYMTTMGLDLGLHEHYDQHRTGHTCILSKSECMIQTRVWQTLFVLESLVGAPQGRSDFAVDIDSVQLSLPFPSSDVDAFEYQTSRRSTFMAQAVRNIKRSNLLWQTMRKYKKDWALDPTFVRYNDDLPNWLMNLPADIQIHYPDNGSPPWLGGDHYLASLHVYHHLVVIMHHRPQMQTMLEKGDAGFKAHLDLCLASAVQMCRLQEALYRDFGFHGLQFMTRGINFTIYCVLTCTMLHLAAITSPDPFLNSQARTFFPRHMRVLEHCLPSSSPDMIVQINALREAFSADTSKAFALKPTLGLRSPSPNSNLTPASASSAPTSAPTQNAAAWSNFSENTTKVLTPASEYEPSYDSIAPHEIPSQTSAAYNPSSYDLPTNTSYAAHSLPRLNTTSSTGYALEQTNSNESHHTPVWDPSGIFNQWNHAFGGTSQPQNTPLDPRTLNPTSAPALLSQNSSPNAQSLYSSSAPAQVQVPSMDAAAAGGALPAGQHHSASAVPAVTPVMWQDAFTNAYVSGHGQKRYREASIDQNAGGINSGYAAEFKRRA